MRATDTTFTAAQIAAACGGRIVMGGPTARADSVCTDTRTLSAGQAFFALRGENHDAHDHLPQAAAAGAPLFVVEAVPAGWQPPLGTAVIRVKDTARALLALASYHRGRLKAPVVAITGSYGKSTVKAMIGAILARRGRCTVAPKSFNNRIGVALTLLSAAADDDYVVLEMGTNHPGEIDELARAARPELGVITAIGKVHLEGLGDLSGVREAKAEILAHIARPGRLVLNGDCVLCSSLAARFGGTVRTFGLRPGCDVRPSGLAPLGDGWSFNALGEPFILPVGGRFNVLNAAAALGVALELGVPAAEAAQALAAFEPPHLRYEKRTIGEVLFICDCYNGNPCAMHAALGSFMAEPVSGSRVVVCGDMLELGPEGPALHRALGGELAAAGVDMLIAVGRLGRQSVIGWRQQRRPAQIAMHFNSAEEAWQPLWQLVSPGDAVLLKGSRRMALETIPLRISESLETEKEAA